jgi:hypothetical protein
MRYLCLITGSRQCRQETAEDEQEGEEKISFGIAVTH